MKTLHTCAAVGLAVVFIWSGAAVAQSDTAEALLSGSTASRVTSERALFPIQVIDRQQIDASGHFSLAELLRDVTFAAAGNQSSQPGSSIENIAGIDLRGFGSNAALVLIDGRRAPIAPNQGRAQNLNSIPLAMVERIEILPVAASAVHGANAGTGVVNVITRNDFTGAELTIGTSKPDREGGQRHEASALLGVAGDRGHLMIGVAYDEREAVFSRDRAWSSEGQSSFSNNFILTDSLSNPLSFSNLNSLGGPGNEAGCQPSFADGSPSGFSLDQNSGFCFYDLNLFSSLTPSTRNESLFSNARYELNENWSLYADVRVARDKGFSTLPPVASSPWQATAFGAIALQPGSPNHPGTSPDQGGFNPFWQDYQAVADEVVALRHRFAGNGPREINADGQTYDVALGLNAQLGSVALDIGARRVEVQSTELGRNYIVPVLAQAQIDAGSYNMYDPFNQSSDVLGSFSATIGRDANYLQTEYFALASFEQFDLGAGPMQWVLGAEYRDEQLRDRFDDLQASGNVIGTEVVNSAQGERETWSVFAEANVPIMDRLVLNAALRFDDDENTGSEWSTRIAMLYQPLDQLRFRGSFNQSFISVPLSGLGAPPPSFSFPICNPGFCAETLQVENPFLGVEQIEQFGIGVILKPFEGFEASVDWFDIQLDDRIAVLGAGTVVGCLQGSISNCPGGLSNFDASLPPPGDAGGLGAAFDADGNIVFIQTGFVNLGKIDSEGLDFRIAGYGELFDGVRLSSEINATWLSNYRVDTGSNLAGENRRPEWRGQWRNQLGWSDFDLSWNINWIGRQDSALGGLPSWVTHDLQLAWQAPWNARIFVGVDNLTDRDPALDAVEGIGYNSRLYDPYGRLMYVRYRQSF